MTSTDSPAVTARVEDTWAALEVDGQTETIRADSEEEVRQEVLRRTMEIAVQAGADTHLTATDSEGEWHLIVTPEGEISETGVSHGTHGTPDATAAAPDPLTPAPPTSATPVLTPTPAQPVTSTPIADDDDLAANFLPFYIPPPPGAAGSSSDSPSSDSPFDAGEVEPVLDDSIDEDTIVRAPASTAPASIDELPAATDSASLVPPAPVPAEPVPAAPADAIPPGSPLFAAPVFTGSLSDAPLSGAPISDAPLSGAPISAQPASAPTEPSDAPLPTLADFRATQPPAVEGPAGLGWRGAVSRSTGGLVRLQPSAAERRHRDAVATVTRGLSGPKTICVVNPKGGAHKTTAAMLIAATFGLHRGGYTLAWDNNETRGTLGWRAQEAGHGKTAVDLLADLERFSDIRSATVGDLDDYVRSQAGAQFDVLASDEDAAASSMIDGEAFSRLHQTLQRFYRIIVVDTGNNMRASNWEAAVAAADQLVVVSAMREDTAAGAAWMVEGLAKKGHEAKLRDAVTILSAPDKNVDPRLRSRLVDHFGSLTRAVVEVPYDPSLVSGSGIEMARLAPSTREAWLEATATIARGL